MKIKFILLFLLLMNVTDSFSQSKTDKIYKLMKDCEYDAIGKQMVEGYAKIYEEKFEGNQAVQDTLENWMNTGMEAMLDSLVMIYDELFTEEDIDYMLTFYETEVGKKIIELTPKLTELSIQAGHNWAEANKPLLEEKLKPIIEAEKEKYTYESLYDPNEEFKKLSPYSFSTPKKAEAVFKSENYPYTIHYDAKIWKEQDCSQLNSESDACFQIEGQEIYSMIIAEKVDANLQQLKAVALANMYNASSGVVLKEVGTLEVNGRELLKMEVDANINGYGLSYRNYYISADGTMIQMVIFGEKENFKKRFDDVVDMNNGIVVE